MIYLESQKRKKKSNLALWFVYAALSSTKMLAVNVFHSYFLSREVTSNVLVSQWLARKCNSSHATDQLCHPRPIIQIQGHRHPPICWADSAGLVSISHVHIALSELRFRCENLVYVSKNLHTCTHLRVDFWSDRSHFCSHARIHSGTDTSFRGLSL